MRWAFLLISMLCAGAAQAIAPNIVVDIFDDMPVGGIGVYGSTIGGLSTQTPNIDAIAAQGVRFTGGYFLVASCTPSRSILYTGKTPWVTQVYNNGDSLSNSVATIMDELDSAGYDVYVIGKWQIEQMETGTVTADDLGFTDTDICTGAPETDDVECFNGNDAVFESGASSGHVEDVLTDKAIAILEARTPGTPIALFIAHKAPHAPWVAASTELGDNDALAVPEVATLFDSRTARAAHVQGWSPTLLSLFATWITSNWSSCPVTSVHHCKVQPDVSVDTDAEKMSFLWLEGVRDFYESVATLDRNVGEITAYLAAEPLGPGELNDGTGTDTLDLSTIRFMISDNGLSLGEHGMQAKYRVYNDMSKMAWIIKGALGSTIVANTARAQLVSSLDWAPTILTMAGISVPAAMKGRSVHDLFPNTPTGSAWRSGVYVMTGPAATNNGQLNIRHETYITASYKLIHHFSTSSFGLPEWEIVDLTNDPSELRNVYPTTNGSLIETMKTDMQAQKVAWGLPSFRDMAKSGTSSRRLP